jgi:1D-myo-inositol 3-kinase
VYDLVVVGPLSVDSIRLEGRHHEHLGGTAAYTSLTAAKLGKKVGVLATGGPGVKEEWLRELRAHKIDLGGLVRTEDTLRFEHSYSGEKAIHRIEGSGSVIDFRDVPRAFMKSRCFHFGPLFNDIAYKMIYEVAKLGGLLSLDPQGYLRRKRSNGEVVLVDHWPDAAKVLRSVDVLKGSEEEAHAITGEEGLKQMAKALHLRLEEGSDLGPKIVLITRGKRKSALYSHGKFSLIPSIPPDEFRDPTGAGDVYAGAFLMEYVRTGDAESSAYFASAAASLAVEKVGFEGLRGRDSVMNRLQNYLKEASPASEKTILRKLLRA